MKDSEQNKDFYSSDLCLSAVISMNYPVKMLDKTNSNKVVFVFSRGIELDELVQSFWDRNLQVEPRAYFEALKTLKSRIYQQ